MHISLKLIKRFITAVAAIAGLTMAGGAVAAQQTAPEASPAPHAAVKTIKQDVRKVVTPEAAKALEADGYNCSADAAPVHKKVKTPGFVKKRVHKKHHTVVKADTKPTDHVKADVPHKTFKAAAKAHKHHTAHKKHKAKHAVAKAPVVKPATAAASTFTCVRPIKGIMPPVMGAFKAPAAPMSVPPPLAGNGVSPGPGFVPPGTGYFVPPVVPGGITPWSNGGGGGGYVPPYFGPGGGGGSYGPGGGGVPPGVVPPSGPGGQPPVSPPGVNPPVVVPPVPPVVVPPTSPPQPPKPPVNPPVKEYCDKLKPGGGLTGYDPACHPPGEPPIVVPPTPPKPPEAYCKLFKPGEPLAGTPDPACNPDGPKPPPPPVQDCLNTPSLPQCQVPHTVPEPGTGAMALSAVAAMALVLFRRGKRPVVPAKTLRPM